MCPETESQASRPWGDDPSRGPRHSSFRFPEDGRDTRGGESQYGLAPDNSNVPAAGEVLEHTHTHGHVLRDYTIPLLLCLSGRRRPATCCCTPTGEAQLGDLAAALSVHLPLRVFGPSTQRGSVNVWVSGSRRSLSVSALIQTKRLLQGDPAQLLNIKARSENIKALGELSGRTLQGRLLG